MNARLSKRLRAIGHQLKPLVTIADKGLSGSVLDEFNRALDEHELIKVKIMADREARGALVKEIESLAETDVVQVIGRIVLVYRPSREANPSLSNILRAKQT